ncbi:MAG: Hsp20/alpha crystallin family protein [Planctomycetota bacterium]
MWPIRELTRLHDSFDSLFGRRFPQLTTNDQNFCPALDVSENKDMYLVRVELPGLDAKDINITCDNTRLTIRGEKRSDREEKEKTYHRIERSYGTFTRTLELPSPFDETKVNAVFQKGILEIELPKSPEQKGREVQIRVK